MLYHLVHSARSILKYDWGVALRRGRGAGLINRIDKDFPSKNALSEFE